MTRLKPLCAVALAVLAMALAGCSDGGGDSGKQISVGVLAPFSGANAAAGRDTADGAKMAADELNVRGGLIGVPVKVVEVDDHCTAKGAEDGAGKLAKQSDLAGVVGGVCPTPTGTAARAFKSARVPFLVTTANAQQIVDPAKTPSSYLMTGTPYQESLAVAHWLAIEGKQFLATVSERGPENDFLVNRLTYLASPVPRPVSQLKVDPGETNMAPIAAAVLAASPKADVVYFAGSPEASGRLAKELRAAGYKGTFIASARSRSDAFLTAAGPEGAKGAFVVAHATP